MDGQSLLPLLYLTATPSSLQTSHPQNPFLYCLQRSISLPGESGSFKLHLTDKPWPFLLKIPLSSPKGLCIPADLGSRSSLLFTLSTHLSDHT